MHNLTTLEIRQWTARLNFWLMTDSTHPGCAFVMAQLTRRVLGYA